MKWEKSNMVLLTKTEKFPLMTDIHSFLSLKLGKHVKQTMIDPIYLKINSVFYHNYSETF